MNIIMFIPTVIIGCIGGVLGGLFVFCTLKMARLRRSFISKFTNQWHQKIARVTEPCVIVVSILIKKYQEGDGGGGSLPSEIFHKLKI